MIVLGEFLETGGAINSFYISISNAFQYVNLTTNKDVLRPSQMATPKTGWLAIQDILKDHQKRKLFYENMWRPPVSFTPKRKVAPQFVLQQQFGDAPITGIDFGPGTGIALPLLNSSQYTVADFPGREELMELFDDTIALNVRFGLNVDKNTQKENLLWAKANRWSSPDYDKIDSIVTAMLPETEKDRFPFLSLDITDEDTIKKIQSKLGSDGRKPEVSFVLSSFVEHQLGNKRPMLHKAVAEFLQEGGIWINIGEELILKQQNIIDRFKVKVYKKTDGRLVSQRVPFILNEEGDIVETNLKYFFHLQRKRDLC